MIERHGLRRARGPVVTAWAGLYVAAALCLVAGLVSEGRAAPAAEASAVPITASISEAEGRWGPAHGPGAENGEEPGGPALLQPLYPSGDPWSLQDRRLARTHLIEQLKAPNQQHRLLAGWDRLVITADNSVSTTVSSGSQALPPWHGYFITDLNATARPLDGLDVNLNLAAWQRTASAGYRADTGMRPGLTLHWAGDVFALAGAPVRADLLALDLGEITVGRGLMFEREWFEGYLMRATWRELSLELFTAGQTYIANDDLLVATARLGAVQSGRAGLALAYVHWQQRTGTRAPKYVSLAGDLPGLGRQFRIGGEGVVRLEDTFGNASLAAMLRADWMFARHADSPLQLHLGYQFRYYHNGFSPTPETVAQSQIYLPTPWNEDTYSTHPTQFVGLSAWYRQWAHTLMFEGKFAITRHWGLHAEVEGRAWFFDDPQDPPRIRLRPGNGAADIAAPLLPDPQFDVYYRFWLTLHPFAGKPYRLRAGAANLFSSYRMMEASSRLDRYAPFPVVDMEVPL